MFALVTTLTALLAIFSAFPCSPVFSHDSPQTVITQFPTWCECAAQDVTLRDVYVCGDELMGHINKPEKAIVSNLLVNYHHFGGLEPCDFHKKYFDRNSGKWRTPEGEGWAKDAEGQPIKGKVKLEVGTLLDRFGSTGGRYLSLVGEPLAHRSLPPNSLYDTNYHRYRVIQPITLLAGPTEPFYEQRGMGTQYFTGEHQDGTKRTVQNLLDHECLEEAAVTEEWFSET